MCFGRVKPNWIKTIINSVKKREILDKKLDTQTLRMKNLEVEAITLLKIK